MIERMTEAPAQPSADGAGTLQPGDIHDDVLVGFDGYLFQAYGRSPVELVQSVEERIEEGAYEAFRRNLADRSAWAARNGAQFLHVIVPERSSIARDMFPFADPPRVGEAYLSWTPDFAEHILYPLDALAEHKARALSPVHSHLREYGSILVAALTAERLTGESQAEAVEELTECMHSEDSMAGDLGERFEPPLSSAGEWLDCNEPGASFLSDCGYGEAGSIHLRFNGRPLYNKRVAVFGDPSARDVVRMLQYWFQEVLFFCSDYFHEEIAGFCKPDIVLFINAEGYIAIRKPDDERPNFFLYRLGEPDAEEPEFLETLNAVLSFPRKPYTDFIAKLSALDIPWFQLGTTVRPRELARFDSLVLTDWPAELGLIRTLESPTVVELKPPAFVEDLSGRNISFDMPATWQVHGSYLTQRSNVLLFGQNHLLSPEGYWSCEVRWYKGQFIDLMLKDGFAAIFPGVRPTIRTTEAGMTVGTSHFRPGQVERINEPVFLATPLEPGTWGRWVATVAPKITQFLILGAGRKFLCMAQYPWQRNFLNLFGIEDSIILNHRPGQTYLCRDVMTVEYSVADLAVSADERRTFADLAAKHRISEKGNLRLFISRKSVAERHPHYRVLQNEAKLSSALAERGFTVIDPETLSIEQQIDLYASAKHVVSLGGSALFNTAYCAPGAKVVTLEASEYFIPTHARFLASAGLDYGIIFGEQDLSDTLPIHKRWKIDVERACAAIEKFMP
jgi:hypothetical protein